MNMNTIEHGVILLETECSAILNNKPRHTTNDFEDTYDCKYYILCGPPCIYYAASSFYFQHWMYTLSKR